MNLNYNDLVYIIGLILIVVGAFMMPSLLVAILYGENSSILSFLITIILSLIIGFIIVKVIKPTPIRLRIRDGFLIVALCWIFASIVSAIPFVISGSIQSPIDAFFEMCSGFSTTGSSILTDVEALPKSMLFWRSFTLFMGGMGILIFTIALLPALGISGQVIARAEMPGPTLDKLTAKMSDTAKRLYLVYIILTLVETILLQLGGMNLFDALTHAFGSTATGGFGIYSTSVAHFDSAYIDIVITVFMTLAGASFRLFFLSFTNGIKELTKNSEFKCYILITAISTLLIGVNLLTNGVYSSFPEALRYSAFQVSSIITTTGYATANYDLWPTFSKMVLFLLIFVGGCTSSTAGGIKVIRIILVFKLIKRSISLRLHPNAVVAIKLDGKSVAADTISATMSFVFLYIAVLFGGTLIVSLDGFDFITSFSAVAVCLGNIGPGFELVGPTMNFSIFSAPVTLLLSLLMLAGRLEIFTIFMLFTPRFWNSNK